MRIFFTIAILALSFNAFAQTLVQYSENGLIGFKNKSTKKIMIPAKYTSVMDFVDGINTVTESPLGPPNMIVEKKWKIINTYGKEISLDEFDLVEIKKNGLAFVYNLKKTEVNPSGYSYGRAIYKIGIIKKDGTYLFPCEFDDISEMGKDHYRIFSKEKGTGVLSVKGLVIIAPQLNFNINEYIGCDLFSYTNQDPNRKVAVGNGVIGGLIDSKLNIIMNQDSIDFCPSIIINPEDCSNKMNLFGFLGGKAGHLGIYRVGHGIVVPQTYNFGMSNVVTHNGPNDFLIKPNVIEIYQTFPKKIIAKYNWNGKLIFSIEK